MVAGVPISTPIKYIVWGNNNYFQSCHVPPVAGAGLVCADLRWLAVTDCRAGAWLLHTGTRPGQHRYTTLRLT